MVPNVIPPAARAPSPAAEVHGGLPSYVHHAIDMTLLASGGPTYEAARAALETAILDFRNQAFTSAPTDPMVRAARDEICARVGYGALITLDAVRAALWAAFGVAPTDAMVERAAVGLPCARCAGLGDGESHPRELSIAGVEERYRLVDGGPEIYFSSVGQWVRQQPSRWDSVDSWQKEAGRLRLSLAIARAMISLFENPVCSPTALTPPGETEK